MTPPQPLFDTFELFHKLTFNQAFPQDTPAVEALVTQVESNGVACREEYRYAVQLLLLHCRKSAHTYNAFRTEIERLLLWTWLIQKKVVKDLTRQDLEQYIEFCMKPPVSWVMNQRQSHFLAKNGQREPNPDWKPFRVEGELARNRPHIKRNPSQNSLKRQFSALNVFFEHLMMEGYSESNYIPVVKKFSPYLIKDVSVKEVHRLSELQWEYVLSTLEALADADATYERNLFALVLMKACYLRISELSERKAWQPRLEHFQYDSHGDLWFSVFGKRKKLRSVSVPETFLPYLERYLRHRSLPVTFPLPTDQPLLHKLRGQGGPGTRQVTRLIEESFELAVQQMMADGFADEARALQEATTHWLRHTGASMDVGERPLQHLADDLGHASSATTAKIYLNSDDRERAESGRRRKI